MGQFLDPPLLRNSATSSNGNHASEDEFPSLTQGTDCTSKNDDVFTSDLTSDKSALSSKIPASLADLRDPSDLVDPRERVKYSVSVSWTATV